MRCLGIRHRIKKTKDGEAHPTQVAILADEDKLTTLDLGDEQAELDFVQGVFPVEYRDLEPGEKLDAFKPHHIKYRKPAEGENPDEIPVERLLKDGKTFKVADKVPSAYDGLQSGDLVSMILGGSGDYLAFALSRRGHDIGAKVLRVPPFVLKDHRGDRAKDEDALILVELVRDEPHHFFEVADRDQNLILACIALRARIDAMKARIAGEQRHRQYFIGRIFCTPDGGFPEGSLEKAYLSAKASDKILAALEDEEKGRNRDLEEALEQLEVYQKLFKPLKGVGPAIASRIIAGVIDIRRFSTPAQLKAYCGVHLLKDGRFPRRRNNELANWKNDCRQALFLLADQFNRRPESDWGKKLLQYKVNLHTKHPVPVLVQAVDEKGKPRLKKDGQPLMVKKWTVGHIHRTALWRVATRFVERLWKDWWKLEREARAEKPVDSAPEAEAPAA